MLESQQRIEAQLHAILDACHPAPAQLLSSIDRNITLAFIADYPTPQSAARIGEQRIAAFCRRQSYRGRVDPAILAQRSYAANTRLREVCMWWAYNSLRTSPWARAAYDDARARRQPHQRALRGLGARWMRVLWRAWTDGVPYNQARHLKSGAAREDSTAQPTEATAAA